MLKAAIQCGKKNPIITFRKCLGTEGISVLIKLLKENRNKKR